jgi:hypothetical protein
MPKPFNYKDKMGQHTANKFKSNDPLEPILNKIQEGRANDQLHKELWGNPDYRKEWHKALKDRTLKEFEANIPNWKGCP